MSRIEVILLKSPEPNNGKYALLIDNVLWDSHIPITEHAATVVYSISQRGSGSYSIISYSRRLTQILSEVPFSEFSKEIYTVDIENYDEDLIAQRFSVRRLESRFIILDRLIFDNSSWIGLYSIKDFSQEFCSVYSAVSNDFESTIVINKRRGSVLLKFHELNQGSNLSDSIKSIQPYVDDLIYKTKLSLQLKMDEKSFVQYFNFPEGLQGACEEYLWSFVQFLKEVGVEATAELKQDALHPKEVLFSVTPKRGKAVLGKIQQALELYIRLAGVSNFEFDPNASIESLLLQSRISTFQAQLNMSQALAKTQLAEIRAHQTTIQAKDLIVQSQQLALDRATADNVFLMSRVKDLENEVADYSAEQIRLLWDIVRIGDISLCFGAVKVNVPKLLTGMKHFMADDSAPTILLADIVY